MEVFVDRAVAAPLVGEPLTDAEFEAQLHCLLVGGIEVLVVEHAGWDVDRVALLPGVLLAADFGVAAALYRIQARIRAPR